MPKTKVVADASSYELGAVLLQKNDKHWKLVVYASQLMSQTECRYAQSEKEVLALVWACDKFAMHMLGKRFYIKTDHKPLVPKAHGHTATLSISFLLSSCQIRLLN